MFKVIVDANVWIRFARSKAITPLIHRFSRYGLIPVVNQYLLSEVFDALVNNSWATENQAISIVRFIEKISVVVTENVVYRISPDPKDNYLFDLAIQWNCAFIISDDTVLLAFKLQPVPVKSGNWFLKVFPV